MEMMSLGWAGLISLGICAVFFAVCEAQRNYVRQAILWGVVSVFFLFVTNFVSFDKGKTTERMLNPAHTYLVKGKGQSTFGTPLLIHDMNNGEDRIVVTKEYPPTGFIEVTATDGEKALLPFFKRSI